MKTSETKRAEAEKRQATHDGLTTVGKLAKLGGRRGESKREKARLLEGVAA